LSGDFDDLDEADEPVAAAPATPAAPAAPARGVAVRRKRGEGEAGSDPQP
jgi:hypothetical protein